MEKNAEKLNELQKLFKDYQKKQSQKKSSKKSREDILKKYFVPRNSKEIWRFLPPLPGRKHIEEAFFHVVPTLQAGGKTKYNTIIYCPAHNDKKVPKLDAEGNPMYDNTTGKAILVPAPCPLCEKHREILRQQDNSIRGIKKEDMTPEQKKIKEKNDKIYKDAVQWEAKKFYIVRGIDRGAEKDGVKFWRFKHNFRNQGVLDKLLPVLEDYYTREQQDFSDPENGTDLNIVMSEAEFNKRVYKQVSAITIRGKSKLHNDPIIAKGWLEDTTTWRDVYKPKQAPGVTPYEYLKLVAEGNAPYWDDTDPNNKHWVFPNHPELEEKANTRNRTFDVNEDENFEQASDLTEDDGVTITNIKPSDVGEPKKDDAVDVGNDLLNVDESQEVTNEVPENEPEKEKEKVEVSNEEVPEDYDDLPF